jgi:hypothetical protein
VSDAAAEPVVLPDAEDQKLITLARATLARNGSSQGASVRDSDGRVYAGAPVDLEHLTLSAVAVAVAMAVSSGAAGLEAAAVAGTPPSEQDFDVLRDLSGPNVGVWSVDSAGKVLQVSQL